MTFRQLKFAVLSTAVLMLASSASANAQCQRSKLTASDTYELQQFGRSVSMNGDLLIVGTQSDNTMGTQAGAAYALRMDKTTGDWVEEQKLFASDADLFHRFGSQVDVHGAMTLISAPGNTAVYCFEHNGTEWVKTQKLEAASEGPAWAFGETMVREDDLLVVGARSEADERGAAYVFRLTDAGWVQEARLALPDAVPTDFFGRSVATDGERVIVGRAPDFPDPGSAHVYRFDGTGWLEEQRLVPAGVDPQGHFGRTVALRGALAVVGDLSDDEQADNAGAAYVFRFDGRTWTEETKLIPFGVESKSFGRPLLALDGRVIVGASLCGSFGAAYVFDRSRESARWESLLLVAPDDHAEGQAFANALSVSGTRLVATAPGDSDHALHSGAAYIFDLEECIQCKHDLDRNGGIGFGDLLQVLSQWGICGTPSCPADRDYDGTVGLGDLLRVIASWGPCVVAP